MNRLLLTLILAILPATLPAQTSYLLKPFEQQAGEVMVIRSSSVSSKGKMVIERGGEKTEGALSIQRSRLLERRALATGGGKGLSYKILEDTVVTANDLEGPNSRKKLLAALTGQTVVGFQDSSEQWQFYLEGKTATNRQAVELSELQAYANRRWFVPRPVKIGESWPIDPAFFRHLILRDLGDIELKASMTLESVENIGGERTAILAFKLDTLGARGNSAAQMQASASINASGKLHLTLDTMLDREILLNGTLKTSARSGDNGTSVVLPFTIRTVKTIKLSN